MKLAIKIFYKFIFDYLSLTVYVLYFRHLVIQTCLMGKIMIKNDLKSEKMFRYILKDYEEGYVDYQG